MNSTNKKILYPEPSYLICGVLFVVHNQLGRFAREKQYGDVLALRFKEVGVQFLREQAVGSSGNIVDFLIEDKIILELKATRMIVCADYEQVQRYL